MWLPVVAIVLVILAVVEVGLRQSMVRQVLPPRTHFYHPAIAQRIDAVERVLALHKRVDVLFIGSSIVLTNVHPVLFDLVAGHDAGSLVSFNAGLAGLWPTSVHLYTERLWLPLARPKVVVQGVRYPELAATSHAKHASQVWSGNVEGGWRESDVLTRIYARAVEGLYLLQYRGVGTRLLQRFRHGWSGPEDPTLDEHYSVRGYTPLGESDQGPAETHAPDLPNEGVCERGRCAVGLAALRRTIAAVRAAGASYVLVNVPEHPIRWRGPGGAARYRHYIETLRRFAAAEGVTFVDPSDGDPYRFRNTPYNDLSHMTAAGARQFTTALAKRLSKLKGIASGA